MPAPLTAIELDGIRAIISISHALEEQNKLLAEIRDALKARRDSE